MLEIVSSANIACGGHAGDEASMRAALRAAKARGVVVGAHPSFPDRENFGRKRLVMPPEELDASIRSQVRTLVELGEAEGWPVRYVKLHGALANMAAEEPAVAALCFAAVEGLVREPGDPCHRQFGAGRRGRGLGISGRPRGLCRSRLPAGWTCSMPRQMPGAVLHDQAAIAERAVRLALDGEIVAADGTVIKTAARSLCIHGDTPGAVEIAASGAGSPARWRG